MKKSSPFFHLDIHFSQSIFFPKGILSGIPMKSYKQSMEVLREMCKMISRQR